MNGSFTDYMYSGISGGSLYVAGAGAVSYGIGAAGKATPFFAGARKYGKWGMAIGAGMAALGGYYHINKTIGDIEGRMLTSINKIKSTIKSPEYSTRFVDTRASYTMRQQLKRQMMDSAYSIRAVMGSEASLYHG